MNRHILTNDVYPQGVSCYRHSPIKVSDVKFAYYCFFLNVGTQFFLDMFWEKLKNKKFRTYKFFVQFVRKLCMCDFYVRKSSSKIVLIILQINSSQTLLSIDSSFLSRQKFESEYFVRKLYV